MPGPYSYWTASSAHDSHIGTHQPMCQCGNGTSRHSSVSRLVNLHRGFIFMLYYPFLFVTIFTFLFSIASFFTTGVHWHGVVLCGYCMRTPLCFKTRYYSQVHRCRYAYGRTWDSASLRREYILAIVRYVQVVIATMQRALGNGDGLKMPSSQKKKIQTRIFIAAVSQHFSLARDGRIGRYNVSRDRPPWHVLRKKSWRHARLADPWEEAFRHRRQKQKRTECVG